MSRPTIEFKQAVFKSYPQEHMDLFAKEVYFYTQYPRFCPKLLGIHIETRTLIIEECEPILDTDEQRKDELWKLLEELHEAGVNHRDVSLKNVVLKDDKVLLIDWENATEEIGKVSADLYGAKEAGVQPQDPDVWWGGPWSHCPGVYWK